jgi:hypothetical protein
MRAESQQNTEWNEVWRLDKARKVEKAWRVKEARRADEPWKVDKEDE